MARLPWAGALDGVDPDRLVKVFQPAPIPVQAEVSEPAVDVGVDEIGFQPDGLVVLGDRLFELALPLKVGPVPERHFCGAQLEAPRQG